MRVIVFYLAALIFFSCQETNSGNAIVPPKNKIRGQNDTAFTELHLDTVQLHDFIKHRDISKSVANDLLTFYRNRDFQYAWLTESGLHEKTQVFWDLHNQYLKQTEDSSFFDRNLHEQMNEILHETGEDWHPNGKEATLIEIQLTEHFFHYARYAYGGKIRPEDFNWNIPAKKIDAVNALDSLLSGNNEDPHFWEPVSAEYKSMRTAVAAYNKLAKLPIMNTYIDPLKKRSYREGDSSEVISLIKKKLNALGDYASAANEGVFDKSLKTAVMRFQRRHGLIDDGIAGPRFFREINVPVEERIQQLLINMERMRWMPKVVDGTRLVANIPSFTLHVYEGEKEVFNMDIVVGKAANRTVVFNDKLEFVVFSPYWNIPRSIVRKEILPLMKSSPNYLSNRNMEITGYSNGLPVIRQKPGGSNALGKVKFIFPNRYSIYFHDTPAKSLFDRNTRAFSHGCIRLNEPMRLAEYLLRNEMSWNTRKIKYAMNSGEEKWVKLDKKVPVLISYFTAWIDDTGVQFRQDVYGHDKKMAEQLFRHIDHS